MRVEEHTIELAGSPVYLRRSPAPGSPPLYLHGIPTSSADWAELLARTGGLAPDLIGFGASAKGGQLNLTLEGHADFLEALLARLGVERVQLVMHDWGAGGGLVFAQRHPHRVERLVLINALPLGGDFRWPAPARIWRRPVLGELAMGMVTKRLLGRWLRRGAVRPEAWDDERLEQIWDQFDQGTQRAILRLHRDASEQRLAEAGAALQSLSMPVLVVWGEGDPWFPATLGEDYARRLPAAELVKLPQAGHWPWLDGPEASELVARFLGSE